MPPTDSTPIPVTIIGGYLGAGKTTLINHLLRNAEGKRLAILVNEFGELSIDADLIEARDGDMISLSGGCVCCSYGNDLMMAMMDLAKMDPRPDHVVLEASGVALPGAVASSLSLLNGYHVEGIVVLADAETVRDRADDKYMGDTITRQLEDADIVLLNKVDLVDDDARQSTRLWLSTAAKNAAVLDVTSSQVDPSVLLLDFGRVGDPQSATPPTHSAHYKTTLINPAEPVDPKLFADRLIADNPNLVRAKGFVRTTSETLKTIQVTGKRVDITDAPPDVKPGVVTISINQHR